MMKKIILPFLIVAMLAMCSMQATAKSTILLAHYGSSLADTRALTIDRIAADVEAAFPEIDVAQCYISPVVRSSMAAHGIDAPSPSEMLSRLSASGYDTVYVQCTTIIEGAETADVRSAVDAAKDKFAFVAMGNPLCYSPAQCQQLATLLGAIEHADEEAVVWCDHGNDLPSTATYAMLDHMLHVAGCADVHVSTIEGYPTAQATAHELSQSPGIRRVRLVPLLLVCGNHTKHDIAGEFAQQIEAAGYDTTVEMTGLAESPDIRNLYVERVRELIEKP